MKGVLIWYNLYNDKSEESSPDGSDEILADFNRYSHDIWWLLVLIPPAKPIKILWNKSSTGLSSMAQLLNLGRFSSSERESHVIHLVTRNIYSSCLKLGMEHQVTHFQMCFHNLSTSKSRSRFIGPLLLLVTIIFGEVVSGRYKWRGFFVVLGRAAAALHRVGMIYTPCGAHSTP